MDNNEMKNIIIRACENWIKYHKDEDLTISYNSVVQLYEVLKSDNK